MTYSLILDIIVLAILTLGLIIGLKRGLINAILTVGSSIASIFVSLWVSSWLAQQIYTIFIGNKAMAGLSNAVQNNQGTLSIQPSGLPDFIINGLQRLGYSIDDVNSIINSGSMQAYNSLENVIRTLFTSLIQIVIFIVLFIILKMLLKHIFKAIGAISRIPVIHQLDTICGGILGIVESVILILVLMFILSICIQFMYPTPDIFSTQTIDSTFIFKMFYGLMPFSAL